MEAVLAAGALDAACFHAQQAAEKCLKAYLALSRVEFPHTHNLTKLVELCAGVDPAFRSLLPVVAALTPYAVELRYDETFWPSKSAAEGARSSAFAVFEFVSAKLPMDIRKSAE